MASSEVILNVATESSYTTSVSTSFTAVSAHTPTNTSTSSGISSVTAAAGALIRGSRDFFSLFSSRNTAGGVVPTYYMKSSPTTAVHMESTDCVAYDYPVGESYPSKQRNTFPMKQEYLIPNNPAAISFSYVSTSEPLSIGSDFGEEYSMLPDAMIGNGHIPQGLLNEDTMKYSNNRTAPTGGNKYLRSYFSGLTGAFRNFGRPATTWVRPDYLNQQQQHQRHTGPNLGSKMSRQCPQDTLPTSRGPPFAPPPYQGKRLNFQDTSFGRTQVWPFDSPFCCGDPQSKETFGASKPDNRNWMPGSADPLPYAAWSNAELSSAQTEDLLIGRQQREIFLAEQNKQYQYYSKLHQQNTQQGQQQNQTSDNFGTDDDSWDMVTDDACLPSDDGGMLSFVLGIPEQNSVFEVSPPAYENVTPEFDTISSVGTHQIFYSEASDGYVQGGCLPSQSLGFDHFRSLSSSIKSEVRNSKWEHTAPPQVTKSQLNPNAKEWTGVFCCKSKLNPEAKEWVPKEDNDDRIVHPTKTITETDVENDLVLVTIKNENIENEKNIDKTIVDDSCSAETRQDCVNNCLNTDPDYERIDAGSPQENCSVELTSTCSVAPSLTTTSFDRESTSEISSSLDVMPKPLSAISTKVVGSSCDALWSGLDCVDSNCIDNEEEFSYSPPSAKISSVKPWCAVLAETSESSECDSDQDEDDNESVISGNSCTPQEKQVRYIAKVNKSSCCESDQDDDGVCKTFERSDKDDGPSCDESSDENDEDSEDETEESESESEDLVSNLQGTLCDWWQNGCCDSGEDSSEDEEDDESTDDDEDDFDADTDDDIVFDCTVDEVDCTSVKDKRSGCCLSEMQKANLRWNSQINEDVSARTDCKISFNEVVRVDTVEKNVERSGVEWERYAMEAKRFRENVLEPRGAIIARVLGSEHRDKIYAERFAEDACVNRCTTVGDAGSKLHGNGENCNSLPTADAGLWPLCDERESSKNISMKSVCTGNHDSCRNGCNLTERSCSGGADRKSVTAKTVCVK